MAIDQLDSRIKTFEQLVTRHFDWLQQEQGFHRGDCRVRDVDEPRDGGVSVRFKRANLTIDVGMALYYDKAGLVLRDPNWHLKPKPHVKCLSLEDLLSEPPKRWSPMTIEVEFEQLERQFREVQSAALAPNGAVFARVAADKDG